MKFVITQINREIELDDILATEYLKYDEILEYPFVIALCLKYGDLPATDTISDKDLSDLCNEVLLEELKCFTLLPKALELMQFYRKDIETETKKEIYLNVKIK